jgi:HEAT repeat protein
MSRSNSVDRQLEELDALAASLPAPDATAQLRRHLGSRSNVVVARAARLAASVADEELESALVAAFRRFMTDAAKTDRGCLGKLAIVEALRALGDADPDVLRAGLRHVQPEPTWGGQADTAAPLRAACALGLVEAGDAEILDDLAVLLADPEADARLGAARALAACGPLATPLLRFKALSGDAQPLVTAECLGGLMSIAPEESFDFVADLIDPARPEVAPHAAMALAESHAPEAFALLMRKWEEAFLPELRRELLLPIGLTRHQDAPDFLLGVLAAADLATGTAAIAALAIYKGDPGMAERARAAVGGRRRDRLLSVLEQAFR